MKAATIVARGFKNLRLEAEAVAEFPYQPTACANPYRMVVVRKNISVEQGEHRLVRPDSLLLLSDERSGAAAAQIVFLANDRCQQENVIDQLKHGVSATRMPADTLLSNWAYMVMAALAWTLKAWFALSLERPAAGRRGMPPRKTRCCGWNSKLSARLHPDPVQVVRTSRRLIFRLLPWNPWQAVFPRGFDHSDTPLRD